MTDESGNELIRWRQNELILCCFFSLFQVSSFYQSLTLVASRMCSLSFHL